MILRERKRTQPGEGPVTLSRLLARNETIIQGLAIKQGFILVGSSKTLQYP